MPKVSVIIPTFNRSNYICNVIDSVLDQTFKDYEIIVVDDGSTDTTKEVLKRYVGKIMYIFQENRGLCGARNTGIGKGRGGYFAFIDSDCIAERGWLEELLKNFDDETTGISTGIALSYNPKTIAERFISLEDFEKEGRFVFHNFLPFANGNNFMVKKEVFEKVGYFDEHYRHGDDNEFSWRMQLNSDFKIKLNTKAIIFHKHRATFFSLLKQQFNYGQGRAMLYEKFSGYKKNIFQDTYSVFFKIIIYFIRLIARLIKYPFNQKKGIIFILEHPIKICCILSNYLGILKVRVKHNFWF